MLSTAPVAATIPVVDIERAKKFYGQTLGLKMGQSEADGTMFEAGQGTMVYIYQRGPSKADHTLASFKVDNLEEEMSQLRSKGVTFEEYDLPNLKTVNGVATMGSMKAAWFKDSEGNILSIGQM